jgi:hypothetical protein
MAVGTTAATHYEREDVAWTFTLDTGTFSGSETLELEIKAEADDADPALLSPTATPGTGVATATASFYLDLAAGSYIYGLRRTDVNSRRQLAQGVLTILESVNVG